MVGGAGDAFQQQGKALGQGAWAPKVAPSGANRRYRGRAAGGTKLRHHAGLGASWLAGSMLGHGGCPKPLASSEQGCGSLMIEIPTFLLAAAAAAPAPMLDVEHLLTMGLMGYHAPCISMYLGYLGRVMFVVLTQGV